VPPLVLGLALSLFLFFVFLELYALGCDRVDERELAGGPFDNGLEFRGAVDKSELLRALKRASAVVVNHGR
jgi:hypothetical protein